MLDSLNSRKFSATRGMEIFDAASFGPNIIARANHIAAVERWNTPKVRDPVHGAPWDDSSHLIRCVRFWTKPLPRLISASRLRSRLTTNLASGITAAASLSILNMYEPSVACEERDTKSFASRRDRLCCYIICIIQIPDVTCLGVTSTLNMSSSYLYQHVRLRSLAEVELKLGL